MRSFIKLLILLLIVAAQLGILIFGSSADASERDSKRVEVDLTHQRLYAFNGNQKVFDFVISTGKPWWPTPTGTFYPWIKLRYTEMIGGNANHGTYYDLLNVPYVVYFYQGYGLHGTYWHNNFSHPMSHGCVNLKTSDAEKLYYWIDMSTPITVFGQTPIM